MWLTAGHMVPLLTTCRQLNNFNEERRASFPSFLPSFPPSFPSPFPFFFLSSPPLSPVRHPLQDRQLKLTLKENPTGTWISLIKSKYAVLVQVDVKCGSHISEISPFQNKTSHLGQKMYYLHHSHTSITSLSLVSAPVLGLEYLQLICLSRTHFSLEREINLSFSPLSAFSLLLPPPSPNTCNLPWTASLFSSKILDDFENWLHPHTWARQEIIDCIFISSLP